MDYFHYKNGELFAEEIAIANLAQKWGTPLYVYSRATLERHWHAFDSALQKQPHQICYAVKANSNLAVLQVLAKLGSGFDIVSLGELERVLAAGGSADKIVFSGVGKLVHEMQRALAVNIHCFNIESRAELEQLNQVAGAMGKIAPIALRVNPDIDAHTHPYISTGLKENKFGIDIAEGLALYQYAATLPDVKIIGLACHIGSQLLEVKPFLDALQKVYALAQTLQQHSIHLKHLDLGGGLGVRYTTEHPPKPAAYAAALLQQLANKQLTIMLEPGRAIAANAGILVTRVIYLKHTQHKNFAIVDAAMNDLIRPSLYQAEHAIIPVRSRDSPSITYDIVGPVCETGDFLGKERSLAVQANDLLAVRTAGAYGFTMSSNYNSRPRAAEIMVDGNKAYLVRARETLAELYTGEELLPV